MHDLRLAFRSFRATPVITLVAVLSLALGIGANTAIFSLINAIALKPLAAPAEDRLAVLSKKEGSWTRAEWTVVEQRGMFERAAAWSRASFNIAARGPADRVDGLWVSGGLFELMGVQPALGRLIGPGDDRLDGGTEGPIAVISNRFWQLRYSGRGDAIGSTLTIAKVVYTIVGVTAPSFTGIDPGFAADIILPVETKNAEFLGGGASWVTIFARLRAEQSFERATAELRTAQGAIYDAAHAVDTKSPESRADALREILTVTPAAARNTFLRDRYEASLVALLVLVGLVLIVACANVATLMTARVLAKRSELAVRVALGASRLRIARQLLAESLLLAALGVGGGLLVAVWTGPLLVQQLSNEAATIVLDLAPDRRVFAFTSAVGVVTVLLFGIWPALRGSRAQPMDAMKGGARTVVAGGHGLGGTLVTGQVALSLLLLVAAGLFLRTFSNLALKDVGFDRDQVLLVSVDHSTDEKRTPEESALRSSRILEAVRRTPGVAAAGFSSNVPGGTWVGTPRFELADGTALPFGWEGIFSNYVGPGWFDAVGTRLLFGRSFEPHDVMAPASHKIALVNETFARRYLKGQAIGHTIWELGPDYEPSRTRVEIIGVVQDAIYLFVRDAPPPTVYFLLGREALGEISVRAAGGPPLALKSNLAQAIGRTEPNTLLTFRTLADQISTQYAQERLTALLSGFFGGLALLLAGIGVYGVTAYAVAQRRTEIGIRMALGAEPAQVVWLMMKRVAMLVGAGVLAGAVASAVAAQFATALLYGVTPRDIPTFAVAVLILVAVSALAGWLPARRASKIHPAEILRES